MITGNRSSGPSIRKYSVLICIYTFSHLTALYFPVSLFYELKGEEKDAPTMRTSSFGRLFGPVGTFSILRTVSIPSMTRPNTTCFPSKKSHFSVVMKNWEIGN